MLNGIAPGWAAFQLRDARGHGVEHLDQLLGGAGIAGLEKRTCQRPSLQGVEDHQLIISGMSNVGRRYPCAGQHPMPEKHVVEEFGTNRLDVEGVSSRGESHNRAAARPITNDLQLEFIPGHEIRQQPGIIDQFGQQLGVGRPFQTRQIRICRVDPDRHLAVAVTEDLGTPVGLGQFPAAG